MKKSIISVCFLFLAGNAFCQTVIKTPLFKNSFGVEFINVPDYIQTSLNTDFYKPYPNFALTGEFLISKKIYLDLGFLPFGDGGGTIRQYDNPDNPSINVHYAAYAGAETKLKIVKGLYFTPSAYFTFYHYKNVYEKPSFSSYNNLYYGLGGTLGFEYFISDRISLNTDLLSMGYGFIYRGIQNPFSNYYPKNYFSEHVQAHVYKTLSLGIHYNFGRKK
ncbi:MAG: hypothetical protein IPO83_02780 [Chitinophagaceae bacterium]|nr:hypothetical protein [Chitinophagaceae bacterium]